MSNRYDHGTQDINTNNNKPSVRNHKKFAPKTPNSNPNPNPTLSSSLRGRGATQHNPNPTDPAAGNFVRYLPQDEAVAAGLGADDGGLDPLESQRVVDLLNRELSRLLKLKPREFWKQVASDTSLHEFLDSFLQFKSRWYDFPHRGAKGIVAGVIVGELDLCRRVFMVLYRISSNKDPGARAADALTLRDHQVLLQEKKLLELPKLFDICAIYGHENEEMTRLLVRNALNAQPWIHNDLTTVISHFLGIVSTMHERCSSLLEVLFSSGNPDHHNATFLQADLLEVMDFLNDAIVSMDAFVCSYKPAVIFFSCPIETSYGNEELLSFLARLHDSLIPSLQKGFHIIFSDRQDETVANIVVSLKMLRMRLLKFGWQLLSSCYLSEEVFGDGNPLPAATKMFPANVEDPLIRADILVQTFREINSVSLQLQESHQKQTFLQDLERSFNILSRMERLKDNGWILIDDEQLQYLYGIFGSPKDILKEPDSTRTPVPNQTLQMDEDAAIVESKISQIRDLFPDYGKGFLTACLEVYDQNPEEVIQRILEGTLHEDLKHLDPTLETLPTGKPTTVGGKDKGKGKLVDSSSTEVVSVKQQTGGQLMSSSAPVGKFVRKSKDDEPGIGILDKKDDKNTSKTAAMVLQYEYDDEYDDSFDDLGLSVADSGVEENETLADQVSAKSGKSWTTEMGNSAQNAPHSKWGSRKKPQYYVKDGKNYSYKVAGAVAVANSDEASLVNQAQTELIHGLGRGGNFPLGAVKKLTEAYKEDDDQSRVSETEGRRMLGKPGSRERKGGGKQNEVPPQQQQQQQDKQSDVLEAEGQGQRGRGRGRGRGGGGGGRSNHYRKDRAMKKHFSGVGGF
ncbi:uncharacterized protein LOC130944694 isoform X1 [Arachis stenosperma]|uniref:uncharacterized protein LOC130944694 isoform X1 n=1 Tax=Arachis stenosperma TaxID=217475 RepID=UPI0025AD3633|nr:uncharacterized protein LOC130944694 isoform X1 [Arachis stenosperma]